MPSKPQDIRIGQILVQRGLLSEQQVFEILQAQKKRALPFGVLAEQMFEITVESIEDAWVEQYCQVTGCLDLDSVRIDLEALRQVSRRQAWQFEILPVAFESSGELLMAASKQRLARAVTFVANRLEPIVYFRVAESGQLRDFLRRYYPLPELSDEIIRRAKELAHEDSPIG
ncbi:MAG: hypothetical protein IT443_09810 [Phycisphaeraceae bacterium]|nr:hypothetical protein [Phycisphaeraceae bacterium]